MRHARCHALRKHSGQWLLLSRAPPPSPPPPLHLQLQQVKGHGRRPARQRVLGVARVGLRGLMRALAAQPLLSNLRVRVRARMRGAYAPVLAHLLARATTQARWQPLVPSPPSHRLLLLRVLNVGLHELLHARPQAVGQRRIALPAVQWDAAHGGGRASAAALLDLLWRAARPQLLGPHGRRARRGRARGEGARAARPGALG